MTTSIRMAASSLRRSAWTSSSRLGATNSYHRSIVSSATGTTSRRRLVPAATNTTIPINHQFHTTSRVLEEAPAAASQDADAATAEESPAEVHATDIVYDLPPTPPLSAESQEKVDNLLTQILWLDMIEVHMLTQMVHERMGGHWSEVSGGGGGAMSAKAGAAAGGGEEEEAEEAKTTKDLKLVGFDAKAKIKVIKEIRAIAELGLKEAKELVESAPKVVQKELSPEKAEELKAQLEAVGAQIELV